MLVEIKHEFGRVSVWKIHKMETRTGSSYDGKESAIWDLHGWTGKELYDLPDGFHILEDRRFKRRRRE